MGPQEAAIGLFSIYRDRFVEFSHQITGRLQCAIQYRSVHLWSCETVATILDMISPYQPRQPLANTSLCQFADDVESTQTRAAYRLLCLALFTEHDAH